MAKQHKPEHPDRRADMALLESLMTEYGNLTRSMGSKVATVPGDDVTQNAALHRRQVLEREMSVLRKKHDLHGDDAAPEADKK
jgi:hypothetical protein